MKVVFQDADLGPVDNDFMLTQNFIPLKILSWNLVKIKIQTYCIYETEPIVISYY